MGCAEETGLTVTALEQLDAFGDPGRDPRGHTITVAWVTFLVAEAAITAGDDAAAAEWHAFRTLALDVTPSSRSIPPPSYRRDNTPRRTSTRPAASSIKLAFDHAKII